MTRTHRRHRDRPVHRRRTHAPAAASARSRVFNPATGAVARQRAAGQRAGRRRRRGRGAGRLPGLGRHAADPPRPRDVQVPRTAQPAPGRAGPRDHRRARQGVHRRAGRGHARHRHRRVRLRHPAAAQGRLHRPGVDRHRQLDDAPAARRGRRHHAVQLPGDGADVDVPGGHRRRQHLRPQAQPDRPEPAPVDGRAAASEAGLPDGVFNVVQGDKDAVDALLEHPDVKAISLRRLDADRQLHLRDRRAPRQARAGAGRRQEPHGGDARRRHRPGGRCADRLRLRLGRRALHGDLGGGAGRRRGRQDHADAARAHAGAEGPERHEPRRRDGPDRHAGGARAASPATSGRAKPKARSWWSTAAASTAPTAGAGCERRLLDGRHAVRQRHARDEASTRKRSSARCWAACA